MTPLQKRITLFLFGCIGIRTLITYIAKTIPSQYLPYMGYLALIPAVGFMYFYLSGTRTTGPEVFGDRIWWNPIRPLHAMLYGLFAYSAILASPEAWKFLFADTVFGLVSFLVYHTTRVRI